MSLNAIASPAAREPGPRVIFVRCRTVANVDPDRVGGAQVDPVLGGEVVDGEQLLEVVGDLRDGLGEPRDVGGLEAVHRGQGVAAVLGAPDPGQGLLRARMCGLRERGEHVGDLVEPVSLLPGGREHLAQRTPEPQRTVPDREHGSAHAASGAVAQQVRPRLGALAVAVGQRDQLLAAVRAHPDEHEQATAASASSVHPAR